MKQILLVIAILGILSGTAYGQNEYIGDTNTTGGAFDTIPQDRIAVVASSYLFTAGTGDTVTEAGFYGKFTNEFRTAYLGLYEVSAGLPTDLLCGFTIAYVDTTTGWKVVSTPYIPLDSGTTYCVAISVDTTFLIYQSTETNGSSVDSANEGAGECYWVWDHDYYSGKRYSIRATVGTTGKTKADRRFAFKMTEDTWINSQAATTNYGGADTLRGYYTATPIWHRILLRCMQIRDSVTDGYASKPCTLYLWPKASSNRTWYVRRAGKPFRELRADYNVWDTSGGALTREWGTAGAQNYSTTDHEDIWNRSDGSGYDAGQPVSSRAIGTGNTSYKYLVIDTHVVNDWIDGRDSCAGFVLYLQSSTAQAFWSSEYSSGARVPYLAIPWAPEASGVVNQIRGPDRLGQLRGPDGASTIRKP